LKLPKEVAVSIQKKRRKTATTKWTVIRVRIKNLVIATIMRMETIKNLATITIAAIMRIATIKI
jgi:hypothetical protein